MKTRRWIYVPLFTSIFYAVWMFLLGEQTSSLGSFLYFLVAGACMGLLFQYIGDRKARKIAGDKDERVFDVRQNRTLVVLTNYETAFNLCRDAILSLESAKIKAEDLQKGTINAVNGSDWKTFLKLTFWGLTFWGTIDFNLRKINENLTEIEFSIRPVIKTAIVSDGRSWEVAEDICDYIKDKDAKLNKKVLADSVGILEDVYVKPFQKDKVER